ncbi:hypothetical protein GT037_007426 [Alternaria burnsii]|uniref:Uncharacterized protein n=1 Tax=Alternaria burnsii TaxID=1187904 RepID=A0A8H7EDZ6_9PLEO|nr:uncharacterized protein GT037_007426 [Alternaria burnsii]KAF7674666.1 hypothetical protein GT037_007426 [Alternaria burnsii]
MLGTRSLFYELFAIIPLALIPIPLPTPKKKFIHFPIQIPIQIQNDSPNDITSRPSS